MFNVHLEPAPYQPYQLRGIEYGGGAFLKTAAEAVHAAEVARGHQVRSLLADIRDSGWQVPTFIVGDFNEPGCLDWTARAVQAGVVPLAVDWPSTRAVIRAGFVDCYRETRPDEVAHPGRTWTPITEPDDPRDRHDRIDLVFARGTEQRPLRIASCGVVGEESGVADVVVSPYPSDHRAVVAEVIVVPR